MPVMPPRARLLGSGFGQEESYLYFGELCALALGPAASAAIAQIPSTRLDSFSKLLFIIAPVRGSILSPSERYSDEKSTAGFALRPSLCDAAKGSGLDGKHRSDTAGRPHDSGAGAAANQCREVCGKPSHKELLGERGAGGAECAGPHCVSGR